MIGLADCNNFYVSCERAFRPDLQNRPVVVLSNNDGCVVSRSNEVKAMGISMGVPLYEIRRQIEQEQIAVFSSNYELYGDMSSRVMSVIGRYVPGVDQYSIDEAFLDLRGMGDGDELQQLGLKIVRATFRLVHIPVSIGVAETKTLAKLASRFAKKYKGYRGVCVIDSDEKREKALRLTDVGDVFGIGRRAEAKLNNVGIHTAWDFTQCSEQWVRKMLTVTGVRTWRELRGVGCIDLDDLPMRKSICTSRSFAGCGISSREELESAIANFAAEGGRKLRRQKARCSQMIVFAYTSRFRTDQPSDIINRVERLEIGTSNTLELIERSVRVIRQEWKNSSYHYKKAGIILTDIEPESEVQQSLFDHRDRARHDRLQKTIDSINNRLGGEIVRSATQGDKGLTGGMQTNHLSQRCTTRWNEIITVR